MTDNTQPPGKKPLSPAAKTKKYLLNGGAAGILMGVLLFVVIVRVQHFQGEATRMSVAEQYYEEGLSYLNRFEYASSVAAFGRAISDGDLPKAKAMKAAVIIYGIHDYASAWEAYSKDVLGKVTTNTVVQASDAETRLQNIVLIMDVALKYEPKIKEFWVFRGDHEAQLINVKTRASGERDAMLRSVKRCYESALKIDPSYSLAKDRLATLR